MAVSTGAALAVGAVGTGLYSANKQSKAADKAAKTADRSAQLQYEIANRQLDRSDEQWRLYQKRILPLELEAQKLGITAQELATERGEEDLRLYKDYYSPLQESFVDDAQAGIQPQYDRVSRDARVGVDRTFDSVEDQNKRYNERRGVRPGAAGSSMGDTSLARAATQALGVRQATEMERDRVESENFNRKAIALNRTPGAASPIQSSRPGVTPGTSMGSAASGVAAARGAGAQSAALANTYGNNAAGAIQAGFQIPLQAMDLYSRFSQPSGAQLKTTGNTSYSPDYMSSNAWANPAVGGPNAFAEGGMVPELSRGAPGMVHGPAGRDQVPAYIETADGGQAPAALDAGEIVIPREVVLRKGTEFFDKLFSEGQAKKEERTRPKHALRRVH